jgi:hypothetical protein
MALVAISSRPPGAIEIDLAGYSARAMRDFVFRRDRGGTPTQRNGRPDDEPRGGCSAGDETAAPERVDEQIASLLSSLEEPAERRAGGEPYIPQREAGHSRRRVRRRRARPRLAGLRPRTTRKRRMARGRRHRSNRFDLYFAVSATVLGLAVGILTAFLVNG